MLVELFVAIVFDGVGVSLPPDVLTGSVAKFSDKSILV